MQTVDTKSQLQEQRKEIMQAINETEKDLTQLRSNKKVTINQLRVLQDKLEERKKLIENINLEVVYINNSIKIYENQIAYLRKKLNRFKIMYSKSIRYTYKSRNTYSMLAYLCSSADFNDAVRRMKYLRLLRILRRQQAEKIKALHANLYHKIDLLNAERASKDKLLAELSGQNKALEAETRETNSAVTELLKREKELQSELQIKKKSAKRINDAIQAIIKREMKNSEDNAEDSTEEKAPPTAIAKPKEESIPSITKAELVLAKSFESNKGKLVMPVSKGSITGHFGKYSIKNIEYFNNGIDIQTITYGIVNSVFEGTVSSVSEIDGKTIVIVQHGFYFTVYTNLLKGLVIKGQHIVAKQPIGLVANNEDGYPTLNFQIWKSEGSKHETIMLNPEVWINKRK